MKNLGCIIIIFTGLFGGIALIPIANLVVRSGDLATIARFVYLEVGVLTLIGGIVVAFRQADLASGLATGVAVAAVLSIAIYFSYNYAADNAFDLRRNSFYTHNIDIPLAVACSCAGYLATHYLRKRRIRW